MHIAVIVPMLNEASALPALLAQLAALVRAGCEVCLVDGGSDDASVALAERAGFRVLSSERGRARQMNRGAAQTRGEVLLFLHADTQLPDGAIATLRQTMLKTAALWGRFDVRIEGAHPMLRVIAAMMNRRSRWTGIATGDQAIFVTRRAFEAVGGYPDQPLMEDIEFSSRLRRLGRPACIADPVRTSGRRWESRGVWRTMLLMWRLRWAYWRGTPPEQLAALYR